MDTLLKGEKARREELILNHRTKLKTPAIYALEVFITKAVIEPKFSKEFADLPEDVEPRFKFIHFPSVKLDVKGPEEEPATDREVEDKKDASDLQEPPREIETKDNEMTAPTTETPIGDKLPEPAATTTVDSPGKSEEGATTTELAGEEGAEDKAAPVKLVEDVCCKRIHSDAEKMKDPNYFNPSKLQKKTEGSNVKIQGGTLKPGGSKPEDLNETAKPERSESDGLKRDGPENDVSKPEEKQQDTEGNKPEVEAVSGDLKNSQAGQQTIFINDGKTIIFCKQPFEILNGLRRHPLTVSLTRPGRQSIIGFSLLFVTPLVDAVDKSVSLTQSVPICGLLSGSFDLIRSCHIIGHVDCDIRLHCFGPQFLYTINSPENPNLKGESNGSPTNKGPAQNLLVVAQMSQPAMSKSRNPFSAKSRTDLNEKIIRDINTCTPLISGSEFLPPTPAPVEPFLTVGEKEEMEKEKLRVELLSKYPQYKCLPTWEVVFNRRVIQDLIAKNRRPFQAGSADRLYIEKYFPELLPVNPDLKKNASKRTKTNQSDNNNKERLEVKALDLAGDWWASDANAFGRKKKRVVKKDEPIKSIGAPSTISLGKDLVERNVKQIQSSAWSRVALFKFDPDNDEDVKDSRFNISEKQSPLRSTSIRLSDPNSSGKQPPVFIVRSPRMDGSVDGVDPVPEQPLAFTVNLPWKTAPHDIINEIRRIGTEVDAIGGDTKEFYRKPKEDILLPKSKLPDHLDDISRGGRTMPDTTPVVTLEIEKGVPMAVPVRATPYWEGHVPKCCSPRACNHFVVLHPGYGFYGFSN